VTFIWIEPRKKASRRSEHPDLDLFFYVQKISVTPLGQKNCLQIVLKTTGQATQLQWSKRWIPIWRQFYFGPKGPTTFFAHEKDLGLDASDIHKFFLLLVFFITNYWQNWHAMWCVVCIIKTIQQHLPKLTLFCSSGWKWTKAVSVRIWPSGESKFYYDFRIGLISTNIAILPKLLRNPHWSERSACASGQHLGGHYFGPSVVRAPAASI
jgi:hypothetical protein